MAAVDMQMLTEALASGNRSERWYFDVETGDVRAGGDWADGFADEDLEEQGWVLVEPSAGRAAFEDMEQFAAAVGDARARDVLLASLEGKGVFRRFRDALRGHPDLLEPWRTWVTAREDVRAIRWLMAGGYVDELDAEAETKKRHEAAGLALDAVRTSGGPTFDVGAVPAQWSDILDALETGAVVALTRDGRAYASISRYDSPA